MFAIMCVSVRTTRASQNSLAHWNRVTEYQPVDSEGMLVTVLTCLESGEGHAVSDGVVVGAIKLFPAVHAPTLFAC